MDGNTGNVKAVNGIQKAVSSLQFLLAQNLLGSLKNIKIFSKLHIFS